jgi:hypothetical protein
MRVYNSGDERLQRTVDALLELAHIVDEICGDIPDSAERAIKAATLFTWQEIKGGKDERQSDRNS